MFLNFFFMSIVGEKEKKITIFIHRMHVKIW